MGLDLLSADDVLSWEPRYRRGEVVRFVCSTPGSWLAGFRFCRTDVILVELCTDWDGESFDSAGDRAVWGPVGGDRNYSWRTLYRIAQMISLESKWKIWDRLESEGMMR